MDINEQIVIFPGQQTHDKLKNLKGDELHGAGIVSKQVTKESVTAVQHTTTQLMKMITYQDKKTRHGITTVQTIVPENMDTSSWTLNVEPDGNDDCSRGQQVGFDKNHLCP